MKRTHLSLLAASNASNVGEGEGEGGDGGNSGVGVVTPIPLKAPSDWDASFDHWEDLEVESNVLGDLPGHVSVIQSHLMALAPSEGDYRPQLISDRDALLSFRLEDALDHESLEVVVTRGDKSWASEMNHPWRQPRSDAPYPGAVETYVFHDKRAWTVEMPWFVVGEGMSIEIRATNGRRASLGSESIQVGPPNGMVLLNVDLGFLTEPGGNHTLTSTSEGGKLDRGSLVIDYFNRDPASQMVVGEYEPVHWTEVAIHDGSIHTEASTTTGGVYTGDMRHFTGKVVVSTGINLANLGVTSSDGMSESQPRPYRQTVAHNSRGMYTRTAEDGSSETYMAVHGLSGGNGQLTLLGVVGNEFSHEYGHDFGMGHFIGGDLSRASYTSGWGYDAFKKRFVSNLRWGVARDLLAHSSQTPLTPYKGLHEYTADAMAGGLSPGVVSRYTQHTPFSAWHMQRNLASQGELDDDSPTGLSKWNYETRQLEPYDTGLPVPSQTGVAVMTLVGYYDPEQTRIQYAFPAMYGNWGRVFTPEAMVAATPALSGTACELRAFDTTGGQVSFPLADTLHSAASPNKFHINIAQDRQWSSYQVSCDGTVLASRDIEQPQHDLPEPILLGQSHGVNRAAKLLRMAEMTQKTMALDEHLVKHISDRYAAVAVWSGVDAPNAGTIYRSGDDWFMATSEASGAPSIDAVGWVHMGNTAGVVGYDEMDAGGLSTDYVITELNRTSDVYFTIPVDKTRVLDSDSPARGAWASGPQYTSIRVMATPKAGGEPVELVLRASRGGHLAAGAINIGAGVGTVSTLVFGSLAEDNPTLSAGDYEVDFFAYANGWHDRTFKRAIRVRGTVAL